MKVFTIDKGTNNITIHASVQEASVVANAKRFRSEAALARLAANWPMARLVDIWNGLCGVSQVTKFKDRPTAVSRIWKAIQILGDPVASATRQGSALTAGTVEAESPVDLETAAKAEARGRTDIFWDTQTVFRDVEPKTPATTLFTEVVPQMLDVATVKASTKQRAKNTPGIAAAPRAGSKVSQVIAMLKREGGTTLEEIMSAMGWQKHTIRAMVSAGGSLTKKHGLLIASQKVGNQRRYVIKP